MGASYNSGFILPKKINRKVGQALHDYSMLSEGDRVLVAVSGGVDSSLLAWLLKKWQAKAPIHFVIKCIYIDNGFWTAQHGEVSPAVKVSALMSRIGVDFSVMRGREMSDGERSCYVCARNRRSQLFDLCREWRMNKLALGHHKDDLLETLFLNMLYSGNISTMHPKQKLFDGEVHIIRPMAYLEKHEIRGVVSRLHMEAVKNYCLLEKDARRETVRKILADIYAKEPGVKQSLFHSLGNVRREYML